MFPEVTEHNYQRFLTTAEVEVRQLKHMISAPGTPEHLRPLFKERLEKALKNHAEIQEYFKNKFAEHDAEAKNERAPDDGRNPSNGAG